MTLQHKLWLKPKNNGSRSLTSWAEHCLPLLPIENDSSQNKPRWKRPARPASACRAVMLGFDFQLPITYLNNYQLFGENRTAHIKNGNRILIIARTAI